MQNLVVRLAAASLLLGYLLSPAALIAGPFDNCADDLPFGVPHLTSKSAATPICHAGYALEHDDKYLVPRWVAYHLTGPHTFGCLKRTNNFHADESLPFGKRATPADYKRSGYDQGHQAPAQDFAWNINLMKDSFSMANMAPQLPGLNRQEWERLEETVRAWAVDRQELIVYVGPILLNTNRTIGADHVVVPTAFWKVVVDPATADALAFIMPQQSIAKGKLNPWQVSIAQVEQAAGIQLPLPLSTDRLAEPPIWPVNLKHWNQEHKRICATAKRTVRMKSKRKISQNND